MCWAQLKPGFDPQTLLDLAFNPLKAKRSPGVRKHRSSTSTPGSTRPLRGVCFASATSLSLLPGHDYVETSPVFTLACKTSLICMWNTARTTSQTFMHMLAHKDVIDQCAWKQTREGRCHLCEALSQMLAFERFLYVFTQWFGFNAETCKCFPTPSSAGSDLRIVVALPRPPSYRVLHKGPRLGSNVGLLRLKRVDGRATHEGGLCSARLRPLKTSRTLSASTHRKHSGAV